MKINGIEIDFSPVFEILVWKYKLNKDGSAHVPDVLLWKVCVELSERTGKMVLVNSIIDD